MHVIRKVAEKKWRMQLQRHKKKCTKQTTLKKEKGYICKAIFSNVHHVNGKLHTVRASSDMYRILCVTTFRSGPSHKITFPDRIYKIYFYLFCYFFSSLLQLINNSAHYLVSFYSFHNFVELAKRKNKKWCENSSVYNGKFLFRLTSFSIRLSYKFASRKMSYFISIKIK